ncbi:UDP-N-acetylmuramoylalanine--D-glutamate ligase [Rhodoligotrophos appendicifer]|uniref:UDP-N-acetylmuramoyl-L-alanine--D-glutamate ligase n=1 Tax=Rhodoligotrophos appendicifer TaxID=987056 RepID=UPI0011858BEA|nr:UDP-N-acetylmuramoyl-L-alanine--D-glutamate ligase [Rhodoligotrophos appendicifer]
MIPATTFAGQSVAVFGLGGSGRSVVHALTAGGAHVAAWDDGAASRERALAEGLPLADLASADFAKFSALVLSPGVPLTHPEPHWTVVKAKAAGIEIIGDIEIFFRELRASGALAPVIAITGTNGKSTTTALCGHLLRAAGRDANVGGNIGTAVLDLAPPAPGRHYVLELSSYQIDLTPGLHADAAILLNVTPDHLDRHGDMTGYAAVKEKIFANQTEADTAVICIDDDYTRAIAARAGAHAKLAPVTIGREIDDGICVIDGQLQERAGGATLAAVSLVGIRSLRGAHNWENAAAAYGAMRALGLTAEEIADGFKSFPGLKHRMQEIAQIGAVRFVNDSKGTNADAAARALGAFDTIYWIAGGRAKSGGIDSLKEFFPRIMRAYLIGEAAEAFAATLGTEVDSIICRTLDQAVRMAAADARAEGRPDAVVLLSPACASFDQYPNFEVRGDHFHDLVQALDGVTMVKGEAA